ncbi:helix-turn-helix transcriptional regulator [Nocardia wallacei]|uniref:helix-turn-helix transcriptional regulator n=1 Tax=Nocardia wallacei TaxID=480035 RepID=UPI0024590327|nr:hypothetical protein [Nocardia wallacei]
MIDREKLWTAQQCADYIGVKLRTWHGYVKRPTRENPAPKPVDKIGSTPVWDSSEVKAWQAARPGSPIANQ